MTPDQEETLVWAVEKLTVSVLVITSQLASEADRSMVSASTGRAMRDLSKTAINVNFELCETFPFLRSNTDAKEKL